MGRTVDGRIVDHFEVRLAADMLSSFTGFTPATCARWLIQDLDQPVTYGAMTERYYKIMEVHSPEYRKAIFG